MKLSGADFKVWFQSDWGHADAYWDEFEIKLNGKDVTEDDDVMSMLVETIKDTDKIDITGGVILHPNKADPFMSVTAHIKKFLKERNSVKILIEVPKELESQVDAMLKSLGVKRVA